MRRLGLLVGCWVVMFGVLPLQSAATSTMTPTETPTETPTITPTSTPSSTPTPTATSTPKCVWTPTRTHTPAMPVTPHPTVVTTNTDSGPGSLRAVIETAQPGDTITFAASVISPIVLTSGEITLPSDVIIQGPMAGMTISGNHNSRIFSVSSGATVTLARLRLVDGSATSGGGVLVLSSRLTLVDSSISGCDAHEGGGGAISNTGGTIVVRRSSIRDNTSFSLTDAFAGGIYSSNGALVIDSSTISGNLVTGLRSAVGGGVFTTGNGGNGNITNSTISGNSVFSPMAARGGGVFNGGGSTQLVLVNATVTDNSAIVDSGFTSGEGGGAFNLGGISRLFIKSTILAGNGLGGDCAGAIESTPSGYNLIGNDAGCMIASQGSDLVGTILLPIDPRLGPLQNNGGPTETHALLVDGPAVNGGDPDGCRGFDCAFPDEIAPVLTLDQTGDTRPQVGACDIGAFEASTFPATPTATSSKTPTGSPTATASAPPSATGTLVNTATATNTAIATATRTPTVTPTSTPACTSTATPRPTSTAVGASPTPNTTPASLAVTSLLDGGPGSLRQAIADAPPGATIVFDVSGTISLIGGTLQISSNVTIDAAGNSVTIDAGAATRIFSINGVTVRLVGLDLTNGVAPSGGTVEAVGADLTVVGCTLRNSSASRGGGISATGGKLTIQDSTIRDNTSFGIGDATGGGIFVQDSALVVDRSTLSGNVANGINSGFGGALFAGGTDTTAVLTNTTLSGNSASGGGLAQGGAVFAAGNNVTVALINSTITLNSASTPMGPGDGGGLFNLGATAQVVLRNSILAANVVGGDCAGIVQTQGFNVVGNGDGCVFGATTGDQVGTTMTPIDALLGPLQDNGGPTHTHALLGGSPAIDAGDPLHGCTAYDCTQPDDLGATLSSDQRSLARSDAQCDAGAFEVTTAASPTPTASATHTSTPTPSNTRTATSTPTSTATHTPTVTFTPTRTRTGTRTPTPTPTQTPTPTLTPTGIPGVPTPIWQGPLCLAAPRVGCKEPSGKTALIVKNVNGSSRRDQVIWDWIHDDTTTVPMLGDPVTGSTHYTLCIYDEVGGVPTLKMSLDAPAQGICGTNVPKPCWKQFGPLTSPNGFKYRDIDTTPEGIFRVYLRGVRIISQNKARMKITARGPNIPFAAPVSPTQLFSQDGKVTAQLVHSDARCWSVDYPTSVANRPDLFRAKTADPSN